MKSKIKSIYQRFDVTPYRGLLVVILPLLYILVVIGIDALIPDAPVTPLFAVIGVFLMAFFFRPQEIIFWSLIFVLMVVLIFFNPFFVNLVNRASPGSDQLTPYIRTIGFMLTASVAVFLNLTLHRLRLINRDLDDILNVLPGPVITSDENGTIYYANSPARKILKIEEGGAIYKNFFELLTPKGSSGATISSYIKCFSHNTDVIDLELEDGTPVIGHTKMLSSKSPKLLVTVINWKLRIP